MARAIKPKYKAGQLMRVKETGVLVRLKLPANPEEEQVVVDDNGYVYVEPHTPVDDWYHISDLELAGLRLPPTGARRERESNRPLGGDTRFKRL